MNAFASGNQGWKNEAHHSISNLYIPYRDKSTRTIRFHLRGEEQNRRKAVLNSTLQVLVSEITPLLEQLNFDDQFKEQVTQTFSLFKFQAFQISFAPSFQLNNKAFHLLVCIRERYKELFCQYVHD